MSTDDRAKDSARVIDFSVAKKAKEDALEAPLNNSIAHHPANLMRLHREQNGGKND